MNAGLTKMFSSKGLRVMNFNRPDIAKAAGIIAGTLFLFFVIKIIVLLSVIVILLVLFLNSI